MSQADLDEYDLSTLQARHARKRKKAGAKSATRPSAGPSTGPSAMANPAGLARPPVRKNKPRTPFLIVGISLVAVIGLGVLINVIVSEWQQTAVRAAYVELKLPTLSLPAPRRIVLIEPLAHGADHKAIASTKKTHGKVVDCDVRTDRLEETLSACLSQAAPPNPES